MIETHLSLIVVQKVDSAPGKGGAGRGGAGCVLGLIQYNTITLFKEGSAITCYSFLTYGPQKNR